MFHPIDRVQYGLSELDDALHLVKLFARVIQVLDEQIENEGVLGQTLHLDWNHVLNSQFEINICARADAL